MFFGKPDRHGSGYRNALPADNFAVLSYCCRKACCGRRFARCGHDEKVYGDDLQRFDSARCACGGIVENRTRNNGNLACMAHRLDDCNRAVAHFYGTADWKNTLKERKSIPVEAENDEAELEMQTE